MSLGHWLLATLKSYTAMPHTYYVPHKLGLLPLYNNIRDSFSQTWSQNSVIGLSEDICSLRIKQIRSSKCCTRPPKDIVLTTFHACMPRVTIRNMIYLIVMLTSPSERTKTKMMEAVPVYFRSIRAKWSSSCIGLKWARSSIFTQGKSENEYNSTM